MRHTWMSPSHWNLSAAEWGGVVTQALRPQPHRVLDGMKAPPDSRCSCPASARQVGRYLALASAASEAPNSLQAFTQLGAIWATILLLNTNLSLIMTSCKCSGHKNRRQPRLTEPFLRLVRLQQTRPINSVSCTHTLLCRLRAARPPSLPLPL